MRRHCHCRPTAGARRLAPRSRFAAAHAAQWRPSVWLPRRPVGAHPKSLLPAAPGAAATAARDAQPPAQRGHAVAFVTLLTRRAVTRLWHVVPASAAAPLACRPPQNPAWCGRDGYLPGVQALFRSMQLVGSRHPLVVLYTNGVRWAVHHATLGEVAL